MHDTRRVGRRASTGHTRRGVLLILLAIALAVPAGADADNARRYIVRYADAAVSSTRSLSERTGSTGTRGRAPIRLDGKKISQRLRSDRSMGVKPDHVFRHAIGGFSARLTARQVARLRSDPSVASIEVDAPFQVERHAVEGSVVSTGSISPQRIPTGIRRIYADQQPLAHIGSHADTDVDIAVIDTGIAAHPDLRIGGGVNCTGKGGTSYGDVYGHGTHVAGIIGARDNGIGVVGVVPGARLWAIKSMGDDGSGTTSSILCGLDWMIGQQTTPGGPRFLAANMSIAGPLDHPNRSCASGTDDTYHLLICAAMAAGIVFAVAAANDHRVVNLGPAIYDEPITVGALADFDGKPGGRGRQADVCPWYSPDVDDVYAAFSDWGAAVDIIAPGKCILSTYTHGRYAWMSGTSMATPHVAGAIALYRMRYPDAQPQQVKQALVSAGTLDWRTGSSPDGRKYRLLQVKTLTQPPTFAVAAGSGLLGGAGAQRGIRITISRRSGHYRPIKVTASSTPAGVGSETLRVAEGKGSGTLTLLGSDQLATGTVDVHVKATDGELSATTTVTIKVEVTPPQVAFTNPVARSTSISVGSTFRVAADSSDVGSGLASRTLARRKAAQSGLMTCDGVTFAADGNAVPVSGHGPYTSVGLRSGTCYQWVLTATDKAGNSTSKRSGSVWVDASAPEPPVIGTSGDAAVRGSTIWIPGGSAGSFTLSATERDPHSGIDTVSIGRVPGTGWSAVTGSSSAPGVDAATMTASRTFAFSGKARASSVSVTAIDGVGLRRVTKLSIAQDASAPTVTITSPTRQTWLGSDKTTIRFRATDAGSGIGSVSVRRQRAPLVSKSAGCSDVSWVADGTDSVIGGDHVTVTGLERDTCYRWVICATDRLGHGRSKATSPVAIDPTRP